MPKREHRVAVVGAGMGGLGAAIALASRGVAVHVFERAASSGGKARVLTPGGPQRPIDAGPTVLTMPWVFDELFDAAGASFRSELPIQRAGTLARHWWVDGAELDLYDDPARSADAIGEAFGASEVRAFHEFREATRWTYEIAEPHFLKSQRLTIPSIVRRFGAAGLTTLAKLEGHRSMWTALRKTFRDPRLIQLFGRYATYVGSSPFEAPATLNLIAYVESQGVFRAPGGIRGLVVAMESLARRLGVTFHHGAEVSRILVRGGRAVGLETAEGRHEADAVVFNGDVSALGRGLLGPDAAKGTTPTRPEGRSLSAVTWAMEARPTGVSLLHHNVFFGRASKAEFDAIFQRRTVDDEPTVYICAQDRAGEPLPAEGEAERLLVLVNAPATGDEPSRWSPEVVARVEDLMRRRLAKSGLTLADDAVASATPVDFHRLFPATGGALYGPRSRHGPASVLSRVGAATSVPGLYLAGGSVHPGAGVPMSTLSGRLAAEKLVEDLAGKSRFRMFG